MSDFNAMQVRTFKTRAEVEALPEFREDNPVTKDNYRSIVGDYQFEEASQCCFKPPTSEMCKQWHNRGYVVFLTDKTATLIGNVCADKNFDAQTKLGQDRNLYANLKRREETQARLNELLQSKTNAQSQIRDTFDSLSGLTKRMDELLSSFGQACTNQLRVLARGGLGRVMVTGIRTRSGKFEGETLVDRERVGIAVGTLRGIGVLRSDQQSAVKSDLRAISHAYDRAASFSDDVKTADLAAVTSTIANLPRTVEAAKLILAAEREFLESDWSALPFLVREESDRTKLARIVIGHQGNPGGRDKAKQWLQQFEQGLKDKHGVNKLELAY